MYKRQLQTLEATHDFTEALALFDRLVAADAVTPRDYGYAIGSLVGIGRSDSARALLARVERMPRTPGYLTSVANGAAALGSWDRAFAAGTEAFAAAGTLFDIVPAVWRPVAADPRLRAMCARTRADCDAWLRAIAAAPPLTGPTR